MLSWLSSRDIVLSRLQEGGRLCFQSSKESRKSRAFASLTGSGRGFRTAFIVLSHAGQYAEYRYMPKVRQRNEEFKVDRGTVGRSPMHAKGGNLLERLVDLINNHRQAGHEQQLVHNRLRRGLEVELEIHIGRSCNVPIITTYMRRTAISQSSPFFFNEKSPPEAAAQTDFPLWQIPISGVHM